MNRRENNTVQATGSSVGNHRPSDEEIASRAYEIFCARGSAPGNEQDDWLQAERELLEKNRDAALLHAMATR